MSEEISEVRKEVKDLGCSVSISLIFIIAMLLVFSFCLGYLGSNIRQLEKKIELLQEESKK